MTELGEDDDAEGEEVGGDVAEPVDPAWDVDEEEAGGEDEEDGEGVAQEGGSCEAALYDENEIETIRSE